MNCTFNTEWEDMPYEATFDELLAVRDGRYGEKFGLWQMLLPNGVFYTGKMGEEIAYKCDVLEVIDKCAMRNFGRGY